MGRGVALVVDDAQSFFFFVCFFPPHPPLPHSPVISCEPGPRCCLPSDWNSLLLTFCCCLCAAKRSIFPASKVLLGARVRMSLALTFRLLSERARAGAPRSGARRGGEWGALCPKRFSLFFSLSFFSSPHRRRELAQRLSTHTEARIKTRT